MVLRHLHCRPIFVGVAIHRRLSRVIKKREQLIILRLWDRIIFVRVALGAADGKAEPDGAGGGGAIDQWLLGALFLLLVYGGIMKIWRRRNDTLVRIDSDAPCWKSYSDLQRRAQD